MFNLCMKMKAEEIVTFYPKNRQEWRRWLERNHDKKQSVWLVQYRKEANVPTITWSEAVDQALCFGWIDSTRRSLEDGKFIQFFTKRKPGGTWSKVNKEKVQRFVEEGLMAPAGLAAIERAKQNGAWAILDEVEELQIPADLAHEFRGRPGSEAFFLSLSMSIRKRLLQWIVLAKRAETREKRITDIAKHAGRGLKPPGF